MLRRKIGALLLTGLMAGTAGSASIQAGFFSSNFDQGTPAGVSVYGSAYIDAAGGVGRSGTLKLTDAVFGQMGSMLIDELDPGTAVTGFNASFKLLIGGGTVADGFSFNFAPFYQDPIIGEEGAKTGLTISFDTYDNGGGEAPAIDIRWRGQTLFSKKGGLELFRTGNFIDVVINVENDGSLDLTVNGQDVVINLPGALVRVPGQFGFGARTGGQTDNHFVDDLTITTTTAPSDGPHFFFANPRASGAAPNAAINAGLLDGAVTKIDPASIVLRLNGTVVPANVFYTNFFAGISYVPRVPLVSGADYNVSLTFSDTGRPPVTKTVSWSFQVAPYRGPNGNIYELVSVPWGISWENAFFEAQNRRFLRRQGHLVTITSAEEDAFVERVRRSWLPDAAITEVWAGGLQRLGSPTNWSSPTNDWFWITGEGRIPGSRLEAGYSNWLPGEPNDYTGPESENYLSLGLFGQFGWNDTGNYGSTMLFGYIVEYEATAVQIDVKPGDALNRIQANNNGKLPVAILGSRVWQVSQIDLGTVRAGRTGKEAAAASSSVSDVNADGFPDLLLQFNTQELDLFCGDTALVLIAQEMDGGPVRGSDRVELLNCPPYGLALVALQDVEQRTELKLKINTLLPGFTPPGPSGSMQLKSYDLSGKLSWTKNLQDVGIAPDAMNSSTGAVWLNDVKHRQPIQAKVQVRNSRNGQIENLNAEALVLYRADLAVTSMSAPPQVNLRQLFNVAAEFRELQGDHGGTAYAYLMDGSNVIDFAWVSVDALGNAGAVFLARMNEEGVRQLRVVLVTHAPDYDPSNNEQAVQVEVIKPLLEPVTTYMSYYYSDTSLLRETDNEYSIYRYFERNEFENFYQTLYIPGALSYPVSLASFTAAVDGLEKVSFETIVPQNFVEDFDCYHIEHGYALGDDNTTITIQVVTDCRGFAQSYVNVSRYTYDQFFHSSEYLKRTGETNVWWGQSSFGIPWLPRQNIATRFTVADEIGTFGGTSALDYFEPAEYFNPFYYEEPDGTRYSGYDSGRTRLGFMFGITGP